MTEKLMVQWLKKKSRTNKQSLF